MASVAKEFAGDYAQCKKERHKVNVDGVVQFTNNVQSNRYEHEENLFNIAHKDASSAEKIQSYKEYQKTKEENSVKRVIIVTGGFVCACVLPTLIKQCGKNSRSRRRHKTIRKIFRRYHEDFK